jgi:hypothetical protein
MNENQTTRPQDVEDDEQLVLELVKLAETIDQLEQRRKTIRAALARRYDVGTHDLAGHQVVVTRPGRLDTGALAAAHPVAERPELYRPAVDLDAVRHHIAPADLEAFKTYGSKQVSIR